MTPNTTESQPHYDFIYLSPHLDDVVWSCGGQIARRIREGRRVLVATLFTGDPPLDFPESEALRELRLAGMPVTVAERRAEDLAAARALGADSRHYNLCDAIYRLNPRTGQALYRTQPELFNVLAQDDAPLIEQIIALLRRCEPLRGATVVAPLAVGHHVDHQLTHLAATRWGAPGGQLLYYEDYPYAESEWAIEAALFEDETLELTPQALPLNAADMESKGTAAACYTSQVKLFFGDVAQMNEKLWAFARRHQDEVELAEYVWRANAL